jgi:hypothetical protein
MPLSWEVRDGGAEVVVTAWGAVSDADVLRIVTEVLQSAEVMQRARRFLSDYSAAERMDIRSETVHTVAAAALEVARRLPAPVTVAQVATGDLAFGLLRMFELTFGVLGWPIATFRDVGEARAWLTRESP